MGYAAIVSPPVCPERLKSFLLAAQPSFPMGKRVVLMVYGKEFRSLGRQNGKKSLVRYDTVLTEGPDRRYHYTLMEKISQTDTDTLFSANALCYFEQYGAGPLLTGRNSHLGSLFTSERAIFYLNVLYRMLLFKRDYELEPLYDDIYSGVISAQFTVDPEYNNDKFRADLDRLVGWDLISFRIEKQRLRGYRDNRKRKFRYRLKVETIQLLEWLEQRLLDDLQSRGSDTRDLLGEMRGSLGELLRLLRQFTPDIEGQEEVARRVLFQLFRAADLCQEITAGLADLNGRLLFFLVKRYHIDVVRGLIKEIERYVEIFLKQSYNLRQEILPLLKRLSRESTLKKLVHCHEVMENERLQTPNLLQARRNMQFSNIPGSLLAFFAEQGGLDRSLHRINSSSMQVWQKLRSHLRELERKNNRLQDIEYRIKEIASLAKESPAPLFISELLSQPGCTFDPNYWDQLEKADPPKPRKQISGRSQFPKIYLKRKEPEDKPVQSMDETRLAQLREWLEEKIVVGEARHWLISEGKFTSYDDFSRLIELAKAGLLSDGKRLARIDYTLQPESRQILLSIKDQSLCYPDMTIFDTNGE
jgi:hypothetical protein